MPIHIETIIWTNAGLLSTGPLGINQWNYYQNSSFFIQENAFENVVCNMAAMLFWP